MTDTLGCGKYEAYFKERGGDTFFCRLTDMKTLSWNRKLNETSDASVTISLKGLDEECCGCVASVNPWEHELAIFRDGAEVWCGPVTGGEIDTSGSTARFDAKDLGAWFDRRYVEVHDSDMEFEEADIIEVFDWLIGHAYYKEPWNMSWVPTTSQMNIPIDRTYMSFRAPERWGGNYQMIGNELRDLSNSGVDYTTIRRTMIYGNLKNNGAEALRLTDKHFATLPRIVISGTSMATEQAVAGGGGGYGGWSDDQIWIERNAEARAKYGLLQAFEAVPTLDEAETTKTPNPLTQYGYRLATLKSEPFQYLTGGDLALDAPVTFDQLIPGRHIRMDLNQRCRQVESNYLLTSVSVSFDGTNETVAVELVPPGSDALRGG